MFTTSALDLVNLGQLMSRTEGRPEIVVALIDGPVAINHPDLAGAKIREIPGKLEGTCLQSDDQACVHATSVAGVLSARRGSAAPAVCPGCTLLIRPIFSESHNRGGRTSSTSPDQLAEAIVDCVNAGAHVINLSSAFLQTSPNDESRLEEALNHAAHRGTITVAAAGNQATLGSSAITRHPWVIPVAACDIEGRPLNESTIARSIGKRGLRAPGENITSLGTGGNAQVFGGTSAAAPFVTGAIALLLSEFAEASAPQIKLAITTCGRQARSALVPPLLDAGSAYRVIATYYKGRRAL
jgi:subtilisin family serine protease